jgi:hypothetical protein
MDEEKEEPADVEPVNGEENPAVDAESARVGTLGKRVSGESTTTQSAEDTKRTRHSAPVAEVKPRVPTWAQEAIQAQVLEQFRQESATATDDEADVDAEGDDWMLEADLLGDAFGVL